MYSLSFQKEIQTHDQQPYVAKGDLWEFQKVCYRLPDSELHVLADTLPHQRFFLDTLIYDNDAIMQSCFGPIWHSLQNNGPPSELAVTNGKLFITDLNIKIEAALSRRFYDERRIFANEQVFYDNGLEKVRDIKKEILGPPTHWLFNIKRKKVIERVTVYRETLEPATLRGATNYHHNPAAIKKLEEKLRLFGYTSTIVEMI